VSRPERFEFPAFYLGDFSVYQITSFDTALFCAIRDRRIKQIDCPCTAPFDTARTLQKGGRETTNPQTRVTIRRKDDAIRQASGMCRPNFPERDFLGVLVVRKRFRDRKRSAAVSLTVWAAFPATSESSGRNQPGAGRTGQTVRNTWRQGGPMGFRLVEQPIATKDNFARSGFQAL
jgi:hypothetical protein